MVITAFPPLEKADENGLLCVGGDLEVESLLLAYQNAIFPWPYGEQYPITWFSPPRRAVLFLKDFHLSSRLKKDLKKRDFSFQINSNFQSVITECTKRRKPTWITKEMQAAYLKLHKAGYCHSFECYENGTLVGGLYGVSIGKMFAGESMFHRVDNASKATLCYLVEYLQSRGVHWIDGQQMTPLFKSFGAVEIPRNEFVGILKIALQEKTTIFE